MVAALKVAQKFLANIPTRKRIVAVFGIIVIFVCKKAFALRWR